MSELKCTRLVIEGDNGREAVLSADGFVIDGPTGRIEGAFADDGGAPYFRLSSANGQATATIRADVEATGIALETPVGSSALVVAGLDIGGSGQRIALSADALTMKRRDGQTIKIPFSLSDAKASFGKLLRQFAGRLNAGNGLNPH